MKLSSQSDPNLCARKVNCIPLLLQQSHPFFNSKDETSTILQSSWANQAQHETECMNKHAYNYTKLYCYKCSKLKIIHPQTQMDDTMDNCCSNSNITHNLYEQITSLREMYEQTLEIMKL